MKKTKIVVIDGREKEITKIKVGKFAQLMLAIENLPTLIGEVVDLENLEELTIDIEFIIGKLPALLAKASGEIFKLLSVATEFTVEEIEEMDFDELIDVVTAILEINNIQAIISKFKNLGKTFTAQVK